MNTDFAIFITNARKKAGLTQTEAASQVKVTLRQWQRYEAGLIPGRKKIQEIEEALKCDLSEVLGSQKQKTPEIGALLYVDVYAMLRVTLSLLVQQEADRTGQLPQTVAEKVQKFVEVERAARLSELTK